MPRLPSLAASKIIRALGKIGYTFNRQSGSHIILVNPQKHKIAVVPNRKEVPRGTLRSIINQAGLEVDEFLKLLD
ncbi:MAG: type II toxin-antitoxin system HicA family toxin [Candidatus Micrarchaeota archaeon]|nr:type II toxin-antitoxin system HicA family toxin [Candidatus Micrarchaeota archaeon]